MTNSKKLTELFARLPETQQQTLLDFALFLTQQNKQVYTEFPKPKLQQRTEDESVIAAIKRLKSSYDMLNMDSLLDETSGYLSQYMVQGRNKDDVIDDLEASFAKHYDKQKNEFLA